MSFIYTTLACLSVLVATCAAQAPSTWQQANATLGNVTLPDENFCIRMFYDGDVPNARSISLSKAEGIVYVSNRAGNSVYALRDADRDGKAEGPLITVVSDMSVPNGITWHEGDLYIAEIDKIYKIAQIDQKVLDGSLDQANDLQLVSNQFSDNGWHGWKYIAVGPDGKMYIPVGAPCNVCELEVWKGNLTYGAMWRMNLDGTQLEQYASGIRNSVGFDWHPDTGELWFTDNGRDDMGDNFPDCELNYAPRPGLNFGFPYCQSGGTGDPYLRDVGPGAPIEDPDVNVGGANATCSNTAVQAMGPHVAPLGMSFYTGNAFPPEFNRSIFVALHGSWDRSQSIGHEVVEVRVTPDGKATAHNKFATGWVTLCNDDTAPCGRPVDVKQYYDGSLIVSDDNLGVLYRIGYGTQCGLAVEASPDNSTTPSPPPAITQTDSNASGRCGLQLATLTSVLFIMSQLWL